MGNIIGLKKRNAPMRVYQYISSKRISHAQKSMHEDIPSANATHASGFNDYAGFYRAFVKQVNVTPQALCKGEAHKFFHQTEGE